MKVSLKTGFSFGLTSGIITTLGLMVGLFSGTHSKLVVIGAVLTIAIADSFSDALGIHLSQESQNRFTQKQVWAATASAFLSKLLMTLTFLVPLLLLELIVAVIVSLVWGLLVLFVFSWLVGKQRSADPWKTALEHLVVALVVIVLAHLAGDWINQTFNSVWPMS